MNKIGRLAAAVALLAVGAAGGWIGSNTVPGLLLSGAAPASATGTAPAGAPMAIPASPVLTSRVEERTFADRVRAVGTAKSFQSLTIRPLSSGRLSAIHVRSGEAVEAGDVLFALVDTEEAAKLAEAEANLRDQRQRHDRATRGGMAFTESQKDQLAAAVKIAEAQVASARYALENRKVVAPFSGTVGLVNLSVGELVDQQTSLTTLDDTSTMEVSFAIPERFLGQLSQGLTIEATSAAFVGQAFEGTVTAIDSRINEVTRTVRVEAAFANAGGHLRPGMFLTVDLDLSPRTQAAVPEEALIIQGGDAFVFVVADGKAKRLPVQVGKRAGGFIAVTGDLAAGDAVVVAGQQRLRDGSSVLIQNAPAVPDEGQPAAGPIGLDQSEGARG